jgi:hypothetical protein
MGPKRGFPSEDRTARRCFGLFDLLRVHSQKPTMSVGSSLSSLVGGGGSASKIFSSEQTAAKETGRIGPCIAFLAWVCYGGTFGIIMGGP